MHNQLGPDSRHRTCRTPCRGKNSRAMYRPTQVPLRAANACTHEGDKLATLWCPVQGPGQAPSPSVSGRLSMLATLKGAACHSAAGSHCSSQPSSPPLILPEHCSAVLLAVCIRCFASASTRSLPDSKCQAQTLLALTPAHVPQPASSGRPVTRGSARDPACTTATQSSQCSCLCCVSTRFWHLLTSFRPLELETRPPEVSAISPDSTAATSIHSGQCSRWSTPAPYMDTSSTSRSGTCPSSQMRGQSPNGRLGHRAPPYRQHVMGLARHRQARWQSRAEGTALKAT